PIVTIKLTHKKPLVAEATQFRVFGGDSRFVSPYDHAVNRFLTMAWRAQAQCDMRVRGSNPIATGYEWPGRLEPQSMARAAARLTARQALATDDATKYRRARSSLCFPRYRHRIAARVWLRAQISWLRSVGARVRTVNNSSPRGIDMSPRMLCDDRSPRT